MRDYLDWRGSIAVFCCAVFMIGGIDQMTKDALKVKHLLRTIEMQPPRSDGKDLTAEVTEKELNAYIAHRLAQEKRPLFNSLKIDLLEDNHIRGRLTFDAEGLNLGVLLGENLDFDFKGYVNYPGWRGPSQSHFFAPFRPTRQATGAGFRTHHRCDGLRNRVGQHR